MFQMMNEARIGVGMGAVMLGYAGYLYSLNYARERPQGRLPDGKTPPPQVSIIEHADVKRMLLAQAYVEGAFDWVCTPLACSTTPRRWTPKKSARAHCSCLIC